MYLGRSGRFGMVKFGKVCLNPAGYNGRWAGRSGSRVGPVGGYWVGQMGVGG